MQSLIESLVTSMQSKLSGEVIVFIISLFPVLELRGGLIAASLLGIEWKRAFLFCFAGNMLPIPFILLFIRRIFALLRRNEKFAKLVDRLEGKADKHRDKIEKYRLFGLFLLVAIPLPGTGGWTGALVAALMDIRIRHALPVIALGVLVAGVIVAALSYGVAGLFA